MSLLSTNYSITSGFALGFACVCESTDLFKALKIVHESSSTKLVLRILERQQLQIYLALSPFLRPASDVQSTSPVQSPESNLPTDYMHVLNACVLIRILKDSRPLIDGLTCIITKYM